MDLTSPTDRAQLEETIIADINAYCVSKFSNGHRDHLGASVLGDPCSRRLFYQFRWCKKEQFSGRMLRLFDVGNQAENRFVEYLRGIGFEVFERNPETQKQYQFKAINGHYAGSADGICKPPDRYGLDTSIVLLNEFKTNGTGAGFTNVGTKGVVSEKPKHYAQMCQFGPKFDLKYGLYLIENKNDSDLIVKIVELDWQYAQVLENKAKDIIEAKIPPRKISPNPAYYECKWCDKINICHFDAPVEINCRSCLHSSPVENGEWQCSLYNNIIPKDFIKKGCNSHKSINQQ